MPTESPTMPDDKFNRAIQAHTPDPDGVANRAIGVATANEAFPTDTTMVRLYTSTNCYYRLGNSTVTVTSSNGVFLPSGAIELPIAIKDYTHIAVIRDTADGSLNITKLL